MLGDLLHADPDQRWGDSELDTQRALIAHAHRIAAALGPAPGRVVLSCRYARSYVPGLLGAWSAGATVELLPNVQPATLDRVDEDAGAARVLHDDPARAGRSPKALYVPEVLAAPAAPAPAAPAAPAPPAPWPTLAVRMTTSGTTERPRYVDKAMDQLVAELAVLAAVIPPARCALSTVPSSHLYGLLFGVLLPLRVGARIASHDALLPVDVAAAIARRGADLLISTPAHLRAMAEADMPRGLRVISSGARMPPELHARLVARHGWHVTDVLGSTETGGIATRTDPAHPWTPLPGVAVSAPDGQLVVASPWCGAAQVALDDRVEIDPDGTFRHLGRSQELVKIAGKRADAHAIEAALREVPGVTDAAVLVLAAPGREPRVAAAIAVSPDGPPVARGDLTAAVSRQFDPVFAPRILRIVPRIPRTDRGKVDAAALRALLDLDDAPPTDRIPARRIGPGRYLAEIPRNLVFLRGHFDAFTILPGAVLIERLVWPIVRAELPDVRALRGIRRLRFRRPVLPDQQLAVAVDRAQGRLTFEVSCGDQVVASGQLLVE